MDITLLKQQVESLKITNDSELQNANNLAKKANELIEEVKAKHKKEIANYHKLHKEAKAKEKEELEPLQEAKDIIATAIKEYMQVLEQRKLEAKEDEELFGIMVDDPAPDLKGTHVRKTWKARIVDESKVPINFGNHMLRPVDMSKLNDIAKFEKGQADIPGVEFYQEETVVIR